MKQIIDNNRLYLALPPLFKIFNKDKIFYAYDEKEKNNIVENEFKRNSPIITRFKGLGEMPADQLKHTTMDIEKRKLINIKISNKKKYLKITDNLFENLMGKKAEHRFKFIQENANFIKDVDI